MVKLGAKRDLTEKELFRMRRSWQEEDMTQVDLAALYRVSVQRLQRECAGLERLGHQSMASRATAAHA